MDRFIITGAQGFIGKRVLEELESQGHLCILIHEHHGWDLELESHVEQCDGIFHIGAISDTMLCDANRMLYYNYTLSKRLFDLAEKYNKKIVYSSSAATYGIQETGYPTNIYGWSKLLAEEYGTKACERFVALKYFNVYGPGEEHKGEMASVAYQAWKQVNSHMTDQSFKLFPGDIKRDFVYIDDVVHANIHAMTLEQGVFDVGTGNAEEFQTLVDGMGVDIDYHDKSKIPDWYQFYTRADKRKFMPGWKPKYNITEGTKKYREYLEK